MKFETKAIHTGVYKDKSYNSVTTPIYPSSTFYFDEIGVNKGYDYTRSGNPTRSALEENLTDLEGGVGCSTVATGMAAITALMFLLNPGDHVITGNDIYGGSYRLFDSVFSKKGIHFSFVDLMDPGSLDAALTDQTKMVWVETPSNPLLHIVDLQAVADFSKKHNLISVVDNTFLSPYFQRPLEFGIDVVMHSTTKYINGHSDVVGGAIIYGNKDIEEKGRYFVNALGISQSPYDAWLVLRGVKTLVPRMELHQTNAFKVAEFLDQHEKVKKVYFTGLKSHPQYELIQRQQKGHSGMIAFDIDETKVDYKEFFKKIEIFCLAESLGGVESLIEHPFSMSHASMGPEGLKSSGITEATVRVSVGVECAEDLITALADALK